MRQAVCTKCGKLWNLPPPPYWQIPEDIAIRPTAQDVFGLHNSFDYYHLEDGGKIEIKEV